MIPGSGIPRNKTDPQLTILVVGLELFNVTSHNFNFIIFNCPTKERNKGRAKVFFWEGKAEPQYIEANKQDVRDKLNEFRDRNSKIIKKG